MENLYLGWNLAACCLVWFDKRQARRGRRRVPERIFFGWALLLGAAGIWLGMQLFHHKTRKPKFVLVIWSLIAINVSLYLLL